MKLLSTAGKKVEQVARKAAAAVERAVTPAPEEEPRAPYDPWLHNEHSEDERGGGWLQRRRRGWLGW